MKRPAFQFYPSDWTSNSNLRRCTHAEKGVWLEIMCLMHDSEEYGLLRWPLKEIIEAVKCKPAEARALVTKGVLKGSDTRLDEPFVYTPRHGRKDGEPVTLVQAQDGPVWFSSRMVKDEYVRTIRGESTRFGDGNGDSPKTAPKSAPTPPFGDGSSSSSSSSSSEDIGKPGAGKRRKQLPGEFYPDAAGVTAAERAGLSLSVELQRFRDYHQGKGTVMLDWQAAWRTWVSNAQRFGGAPKQSAQAKTISDLTGGLASVKGAGNALSLT